jgi:glucosyl-3-phosphoglycerate phosphatase
VTRLIIWRHGQTSWNTANRFQGQADVPLDDVGHAQAVAAAEVLATEAPDVIVTSDLQRASDTAAALAAVTGLPAHPDPRLRERYFGTWEGLLRSEVKEKFPDEFAKWTEGDPAPGCDIEPLDELASRVAGAFAAALDRAHGGTVVAVTHGAAARYGIGRLLGWSNEQMSKFGMTRMVSRSLSRSFPHVLSNCHWAELGHDAKSGWVLRAYNRGVLRP